MKKRNIKGRFLKNDFEDRNIFNTIFTFIKNYYYLIFNNIPYFPLDHHYFKIKNILEV